MAEPEKRRSKGLRYLIWIIVSIVLAVLSALITDRFPPADAWKYILGVVIFLVGLSLSTYYEIHIDILPEIRNTLGDLSNELKKKIALIDTFDQISKYSPEASVKISNDFLTTIKNLILKDKHYWWFLNRELDKFSRTIEEWIANGCKTHGHVKVRIIFLKSLCP